MREKVLVGTRTCTQEADPEPVLIYSIFVVSKNVSLEWSRHIFLDFRLLWGFGDKECQVLSHLILSLFSHGSTAHPPSLPSPFDQQLISLKMQHPLYFQIQAEGAGGDGGVHKARAGAKLPRQGAQGNLEARPE